MIEAPFVLMWQLWVGSQMGLVTRKTPDDQKLGFKPHPILQGQEGLETEALTVPTG